MNVLVVSGFLGAGKTTFIKELIHQTQERLVVLENEYGQNNLDSQELSGTGENQLELLEFMEGCVCCTQKDTFSNTILTISASLDPDYLVVEPTGVGKLSNVLTAIQKVSYERITLLKPIVVLAPRGYHRNMAEYGDIYRDQIQCAERIVLSKTEQEDPAIVDSVCHDILQLNPSVEIISTHYTSQPESWWKGILTPANQQESSATPLEKRQDASEKQTEENAKKVMEVSFADAKLNHLGELILLLEDVIRGEFGPITRGKGVLPVGSMWMRFDVADGLYAIIQAEEDQHKNQCVWIGREIDRNHLSQRLGSGSHHRLKRGNMKKTPLNRYKDSHRF